MTAAIYFRGEGYSTAGAQIMGRQAAGEGFLRGFLAYAKTDRFRAICAEQADADQFVAAVRGAGRHEPIDISPPSALGAMEQAGTVYYPAPTIVEAAQQRALSGDRRFSLTGVFHTTASARVADAIAALPVAPVQPWDALICPSTAVKANVEIQLAAAEEALARRVGASRFVRPQLPIIPLGVHSGDFAGAPGARETARAALGLEDDAVVVLYVGRLSFHAKAHPAAMYAALEAARGSAPGRVVLIECGWFANDSLREGFAAAAALLCPSVAVRRVDGRDPAARAQVWAAADVFCSLADNIQETFGLTPIEAMAAGLPVVVSDWDGYRDTVRDGVDGYRVPTWQPAAGLGGDLAARHALGIDSYDRYCGYTAAFIGVDIAAAAAAFARLFSSAELRRAMGAAGQGRARDVYDWRHVIGAYEALWTELAAIRRSEKDAGASEWTARMDPYRAFAAYPTRTLGSDTRVALAMPAADAAARLVQLRALFMVSFADAVLPDAGECAALIAACAGGPARAGDVAAMLPPARRAHGVRALAWLAKLGIVVLP